MTAYLRALDAHREALRTPSLRDRVTIAIGDAIERIGPCPDCDARLACGCNGDPQADLVYLGALDAAIPHLPDAGIAAVAEALGVTQ